MSTGDLIVIACLGIVSGAINVLAGAGSLLTYPFLIALGLSPVTANVTNDLGVVPGNISGAVSQRAQLHQQGELLRMVIPRAVVGSAIGAAALLLLPGTAFAWVAPPLLLVASALTLAQPAISRRTRMGARRGRILNLTVDATSIYGGYFGTGIGLMYSAVLGVLRDETPTQLNATKTVLQMVANGIAGIVFVFVAHIDWAAAAALALGSIAGGQVGARLTRRVSGPTLRAIVATIGILAGLWLAAKQLQLS